MTLPSCTFAEFVHENGYTVITHAAGFEEIDKNHTVVRLQTSNPHLPRRPKRGVAPQRGIGQPGPFRKFHPSRPNNKVVQIGRRFYMHPLTWARIKDQAIGATS